MIELVKGVEKPYTPATDVNLQVNGVTVVYLTQDNTQPKKGWFRAKSGETIRLAAGSTWYLWCNLDNVLAEEAV